MNKQEAIQEIYKGNYEGLHRRIKMNRDNFIYATIITGSLDLIRDLPEGDEINMCKAMDQLFQRFENQGIEKGEAIGIEKTLKEQLKVKLGTLSRPLEKQLTNTSLEKLNVLTLNIFNINSEEDVLKIISLK